MQRMQTQPATTTFRLITRLACLGLLSLLSACASTPPMAPLLEMPDFDPAVRDRIVFRISTGAVSDASNNAVLSKNADIRPGSSVVIDVPTDIEFERRQTDSDTEPGVFRTSNYFNFAERAMEKQLLVGGFVVKDRSKFEAILRDLRDVGFCKPYWWSCFKVDPAIESLLKDLEDKRERGEISNVDYANQVQDFRNRLQLGGTSRKPGDTELVDTSEVIRAASASEVQADYLLQVNDFDTSGRRRESINILANEEFREFYDKYDAVKAKFNSERNTYFECEVAEASLNAKLIHVSSGNVVWIGSHRVTELDHAENQANIDLEVTYERRCTNCSDLRDQVMSLNTDEARTLRHGQTTPVFTPRYTTAVSNVRKISGSQCSIDARTDLDEVRPQLASRVAEELIGTIRFTVSQGSE